MSDTPVPSKELLIQRRLLQVQVQALRVQIQAIDKLLALRGHDPART